MDYVRIACFESKCTRSKVCFTASSLTSRLLCLIEGFAETPKDILIIDQNGESITQGDTDRRFFEASWMHKYKNKYYFSYSTGDTHKICYATGDNPYGPFVFQGIILTPVIGWTTHHSILEFKNKWYLFHHDCLPSNGITWLRSMKVIELEYNYDGSIKTIQGSR